MDKTTIIITLGGLFFIIVFISGFKLKKTGHPYSFISLIIHKLTSLAGLVLIILGYIEFQNEIGMKGLGIILISLSIFFYILALISGGILSAKKTSNKFIILTHSLSPIFIIMAAILLFSLVFIKP